MDETDEGDDAARAAAAAATAADDDEEFLPWLWLWFLWLLLLDLLDVDMSWRCLLDDADGPLAVAVTEADDTALAKLFCAAVRWDVVVKLKSCGDPMHFSGKTAYLQLLGVDVPPP